MPRLPRRCRAGEGSGRVNRIEKPCSFTGGWELASDLVFALVDELDRAGVEFAPAVARGFVAALDELATQHAHAGDVGRYGDAAIARACGWTRSPGALVALLLRAGVLAQHDHHRLVLVGWWERADDAVHAAVARARAFFTCGRGPKLRQLPSTERKDLEAWYAETSFDRAETAVGVRSGQLLLFSSLRRDLQEEEKISGSGSEHARDVSPRAHRTPPAVRRITADPPGLDEAIDLARGAAKAYGREFGEVRGVLRDLAVATMREHPERGVDALAQCFHGYWALRGKPARGWEPLDNLQPKTVWKADLRGGYLDAHDAAIARGLSPPFVRAGPHRAPKDVAWMQQAKAQLEERCRVLHAVALDVWGDEARADRERQGFAAHGGMAIACVDRHAFAAVLADLAADVESIEQQRATPRAAAGAGP